jgi:hypothetical protein
MTALLTRVAYAAHAKLSRARIDRLIEEGLPTSGGKIDAAAADAWRASCTDLRKRKLAIDNQISELKLSERSGSLVPRDAAERYVFEELRKVRDNLIGWVARSAPVVAHELDADPQLTFATLDRLVREFLTELAHAPQESVE